MDEVKEAVNTTESAPVENQEVVKEQPDATEQVEEQSSQEVTTEATPEEETQTQPLSEGKTDELLDEFGVPYKNRAAEWKRKAEDLAERLPTMLDEKLKEAFQQYGNQSQQKEYTIAELEAFAIQNPEHRPWVEEQKEQLRLRKLTAEMDNRLQATEKQRQATVKRQQALQYVMNTYPEAFQKTPNGQIGNWNNSHPMVQEIGRIMKDPRFLNDPEGLAAASDIAYARYARMQKPATMQKEQKLKQEVKELQKQTLVEGGGRQGVQGVPKHRAAIEKLKQTGSLKDAEKALNAIFEAHKPKEV